MPEPVEDELVEEQETRSSGQPLWLQITAFVLAISAWRISAYETYAHFNGSHLAGSHRGQRHVQLHPSSPARSRWSSA
jgi:hypothetical protein